MDTGGREINTSQGSDRSAKKADEEKEEETLEDEEDQEVIFVMPGDIVGTTEEFSPGDGTYVLRGDIHSMATGNVNVDKKRRIISVVPTTSTPPELKEGEIVVGEVANVRDSVVLVSLQALKGAGEREFQVPGMAAIHVSNVKDSYVKDLSREFAVSDAVKAKVINMDNMRLDTSDKSLGVMKANCSKCRTVLVKDNKKLKCPACGNVETRKISSDYGTGII